MRITVYLMRKNGIEVPRDRLGDEPQFSGELCMTTGDPAERRTAAGSHRRGKKGACFN